MSDPSWWDREEMSETIDFIRGARSRGWSDLHIAEILGSDQYEGAVNAILGALDGTCPEFTDHDSMGRWFGFAAMAHGWSSHQQHVMPLRHLGPCRRQIADLVIAGPSSVRTERPRYVVEFKMIIRHRSELDFGIRQVTRYADYLEDAWPGADIEAVLAAPTIRVGDACEYGAERGVRVCTTAELAILLRSRGWLDCNHTDRLKAAS